MITGMLLMAILCTSFISWMLISGVCINIFVKDPNKALMVFMLSGILWTSTCIYLLERFIK